MSKKIFSFLNLLMLCLSFSIILPNILLDDYSIVLKIYFILMEYASNLFVVLLIISIIIELFYKEYYKCSIIRDFRITNFLNILGILLLFSFIIIKNITLQYNFESKAVYIIVIYMFIITYSISLIRLHHFSIFLNNDLIYLSQLKREIKFNDIKSLKVNNIGANCYLYEFNISDQKYEVKLSKYIHMQLYNILPKDKF